MRQKHREGNDGGDLVNDVESWHSGLDYALEPVERDVPGGDCFLR